MIISKINLIIFSFSNLFSAVSSEERFDKPRSNTALSKDKEIPLNY